MRISCTIHILPRVAEAVKSRHRSTTWFLRLALEKGGWIRPHLLESVCELQRRTVPRPRFGEGRLIDRCASARAPRYSSRRASTRPCRHQLSGAWEVMTRFILPSEVSYGTMPARRQWSGGRQVQAASGSGLWPASACVVLVAPYPVHSRRGIPCKGRWTPRLAAFQTSPARAIEQQSRA